MYPWIRECTNYLMKLNKGQSLGELEDILSGPTILIPNEKKKGHRLLQPLMVMNEAHYLRKGLVKLYSIDPVSGDENIFYIWEADSIIVLYKSFRMRLRSKDLYIELMTDCELVSISNFNMDDIYTEHLIAHELTQTILTMKSERRMMQIEILLMTDKKFRYCVMKEKFPGLFDETGRCLLTTREICGFIGLTDSTLSDAKRLCKDNKDNAIDLY